MYIHTYNKKYSVCVCVCHSVRVHEREKRERASVFVDAARTRPGNKVFLELISPSSIVYILIGALAALLLHLFYVDVNDLLPSDYHSSHKERIVRTCNTIPSPLTLSKPEYCTHVTTGLWDTTLMPSPRQMEDNANGLTKNCLRTACQQLLLCFSATACSPRFSVSGPERILGNFERR
jgi:hypothetical protein